MNLNTLEIRILLKCDEGLLSRRYFSNLYKKYSAIERKEAIKNLTNLSLIRKKEMPKPGAKITPVFYQITKKGKKWVEDYLNNYPN